MYPRLHVSLLPTLVVVAVSFWSRMATAEVVVAVGGDAEPATRAALTAAVTESLREHQVPVREPRASVKDVDALIRCVSDEVSEECAAKVMESEKATRSFAMRVVRHRSTTTIYGWVVAKAGGAIVVSQRVCDACDDARLLETARALVAALLKDVETRTLPTRLVVRSKPEGAQVVIDGRVVGVTPLEHRIYAGLRRIDLHLYGYESSNQEREALPGETTVVDVRMRPKAKMNAASGVIGEGVGGAKPPRFPRWKPLAVIGAGLLVVSGGGLLVALDEDRTATRAFEVRDTATLGVGGIVVGLAVAAAGTYWFVREGQREERGPIVTVGGDGAVLGFGGSF